MMRPWPGCGSWTLPKACSALWAEPWPTSAPEFEFLRQRGFFEAIEQPQLKSPLLVDNTPFRSEGMARPPLRPTPEVGEHTRQVLRDVLGLGDSEIDSLIAQKVVTTA